MFKYIKTIHSHTVAETSRRAVDPSMTIPSGTICQINDGLLTHACDPGKAYYLVIEEKKCDDGKRELDCIRLLPGMMLIGTSEFDAASAMIGENCSFTTDNYDQYTLLADGGSIAEIVETDGQHVTFIIH